MKEVRLSDSTYDILEKTKLKGQKTQQWLPEAGGNERG